METKNQILSNNLLQDLIIGDRVIKNRLVLAPMADLGHIAARRVISGYGGYGLLFTGMCSAKAVRHENPETSLVFKWRKEELSHLVCQIFGPDPDSMARAAARIEKEGFFGVDLNFGCCVAAICKKGCGAALLKTPHLAADIVKKVRKAVSIPLFVKFRIGWESNPVSAADMARRFEDAGADALTFHPRTAPDRRSRPPAWDAITRVVEAVNIPVFGNGNLFLQEDGLKMMGMTSCQGLSIGRMAIARPWLFAQWTQGFKPDDQIYHSCALKMADALLYHYQETYALRLFKKFSAYFCANFKFGHQIRKQLVNAETMKEIVKNIDSMLIPVPETVKTPNLNLFL